MRTLAILLASASLALAVGEGTKLNESDIQIRCGFLNMGVTNPPVAIRNGVVLANPHGIKLPGPNECPGLAAAKTQWAGYLASQKASRTASVGVTNLNLKTP